VPITEFVKSIFGRGGKEVTPLEFKLMSYVVTGQLFTPRGTEMHA
jgi:hypothetical protein